MPDEPKKIPEARGSVDALDACAVVYVILPLGMFLLSWFKVWAAIPLAACLFLGIAPLLGRVPWRIGPRLTGLQWGVVIAVSVVWTLGSGLGHLLYANADWYIRDAVLHDLVKFSWPVGYGGHDGAPTILRAPLAYFLPAALVGKLLGLKAAHWCLAAWTALGVALFIAQVLSLLPSRPSAVLFGASLIVLFSGMDFIGNIINWGPRFLALLTPGQHLEWWAGSYQYSSMTTQLYWVPNHAIAAWLAIGLLYRDRSPWPLTRLLPIIAVACLVWSPLSAIGLLPFLVLRMSEASVLTKSAALAHPKIWLPASLVACAIGAYYALDLSGIPRGMSFGAGREPDYVDDLLRQFQFFFIEAGCIGLVALMIRPSRELILALVILAVLPAARFGPGNDLVMRGSIPSLTILMIGCALALTAETRNPSHKKNKRILVGLLLVGAITPLSEIVRAFILPAWPIHTETTLISANCNSFPPHYTARLRGELITYLLDRPDAANYNGIPTRACENPAWELMIRANLL